MFFRLLICSTTQSQVLLSWLSSNCLLACWYSFRIAAAQPLKMMLFLKLAWAGRGAVSAMTAKTIIPHCGFMAPSFLFQQQLKLQCVVMADSHSVIIFSPITQLMLVLGLYLSLPVSFPTWCLIRRSAMSTSFEMILEGSSWFLGWCESVHEKCCVVCRQLSVDPPLQARQWRRRLASHLHNKRLDLVTLMSANPDK